MTVILALFLAFADVASIKAEPNPEKRSDLALEVANQAIDDARASYEAGDLKKANTELDQVRESVDLSLAALEESGKKPRNSKYYKQAEIKLRHMMRRLSGFRDQMSVDDRKSLEEAAARVQEVHDRLLAAIMGKKR